MSGSLENVQPGDKLIYNTGGPMSKDVILMVKRVTRTQVIAPFHDMELRFRKKNGDEIGSTAPFFFPRARIPKEGELEKVRQRIAVNRARSILSEALGVSEQPYCDEAIIAAAKRLIEVQDQINTGEKEVSGNE